MGATCSRDHPPALPSSPPAPVAVVSPQYCARRTVPLTVTKMPTMTFNGGDFTVTDDDANDGAAVLLVEGVWFSAGSCRVLHDAAGRPILTMERERKLFSMHRTWKVFRGDSTSSRDLLFTVKKTSIFQLKTSVGVFLAENTSEEACDFMIEGSYCFDFEGSCAFYHGNSNTMIAQMKREFSMLNVLLGKDTYSVTVFPNIDYVFITALVVILDDIDRNPLLHRRSYRSARTGHSHR
ncbi:unnamed protein product [Urochloa decumbens]|uniref:Uncharacterized protein n=1 Tax=Urochloa decumbens TaxID=240449 RepID=A0ABC9EY72_9POAL